MYTLVCYRPEGVETCRGQVMSESSSDFEIHYFKHVKDAVMKEAEFHMFNFSHPREFSEWEITVLVDGLNEDQWWNVESNYNSHSNDESNVWRNYQFHLKNAIAFLKSEKVEQDLLKKKQDEQKRLESIASAIRVKEENERVEYERLVKKFGEVK